MIRAALLIVAAGVLQPAAGQVELILLFGGLQRPPVVRQVFDAFTAANPGITVTLELGGATSDVHRQLLGSLLSRRSSDVDVFLLDTVHAAEFAAAGWIEPLDGFFAGDAELAAFAAQFHAPLIEASSYEGSLYGIPVAADAQFLYYRSDLLEAYGFEPPRTWEELETQALTILAAENDPGLEGFSYQGAAIEGTNCTFLQAFWAAGGEVVTEAGVTVASEAGRRALSWFRDTLASGITFPEVAQATTDTSRQDFQAGRAVFMLNWSFAWTQLQGSSAQPSLVAGKVGVALPPAFEGYPSATCLGGAMWAVSAFSRHKPEAFKLISFLSAEPIQKLLAVQQGNIPSRWALADDPEVQAAAPFLAWTDTILELARRRPVTPFYGQASEVMRTTMNAFLAGELSVDEALEQMQWGLETVLEE